jgi:hypothetical protein
VKNLNKKALLLNRDVIEECLSESLDILEKDTPVLKKSSTSHIKIKRPLN